PGMLTSVQDLGRLGCGVMGISPSGAADQVSLRIGNRLVGNPENASALEMTLVGGHFQFSDKTMIAITGADFSAAIGRKRVPQYQSVTINAGETLEFGPSTGRARAYLCIQGGIDVPEFLGSRSTHLLSGHGGHEGRALRRGDVLKIGKCPPEFRFRRLAGEGHTNLVPRTVFRVTQGPQWDLFSDATKRAFFDETYRVTEVADRTGIRLEGAPLELKLDRDMLTEGVALGAVQIPRDGKPIILFVEQQTTGGYPKIANVIGADLNRLGQLQSHHEIRFELVGWEAARALLLRLEEYLTSPELIRE
ncbi:MAG TPA: biotin-dependent carboxyltransferase family protein, partial [Candidatus Eremiobacteraceae bacterium]|nr:biotin-dependent carboxyltransferase family protein [Candidatus Eremiobacteraceae bacterium]